jgi:hypothetical protein
LGSKLGFEIPLKKRLLLVKFSGKKIISVFPKETSHVQSLRYLWKKADSGLQRKPRAQQNPRPVVPEPAKSESRQRGPNHEDESLHQLSSIGTGDQGLEQAAEKRPSAAFPSQRLASLIPHRCGVVNNVVQCPRYMVQGSEFHIPRKSLWWSSVHLAPCALYL